jgi:hypothetical protein
MQQRLNCLSAWQHDAIQHAKWSERNHLEQQYQSLSGSASADHSANRANYAD